MISRRICTAAIALLLTSSGATAFQPYLVYGAIYAKWNRLHRESGPLGPARSSEANAARGGRFNNFAYGFIYWHPPDVEAFAVYGLIGERWNALGRERGVCGYPRTDEYGGSDSHGPYRRNTFERGYIIWRFGDPRAVDHCGVVIFDDD